MKNFIAKMTPLQKIYAVCFVAFTLFNVFHSYMSSVVYIVPESELNYASGVITQTKSRTQLTEIALETDRGLMRFSCHYRAYTEYSDGVCYNNTTMVPYLGKTATIGWYHQPSYLGFHNDLPQLVAVDVDDKTLESRSYERTYDAKIRYAKIQAFIKFLLIEFLIFIIFYFANKYQSD